MSSIDLNEQVLKNIEASMEATAKPERKKKAATIKVVYPPGTKKFSDVFGFVPPSGIDHAVPEYTESDWHPEVVALIPKINGAFVYPQVETELAVVGITGGDRVLAVGPTGSGKSTLFQQICARLKLPFTRVNCREDMESSAIFGTIKVEKGSMLWHDGPAALHARHGGILCVDEISAAPAGINMAMQSMLEDGGVVYLADKPGDSTERTIHPVRTFGVVATDNTELQGDTTGKYAGTNAQNMAMLDRFGTVVKLGYLSQSHEIEVLKNQVEGIEDGDATRMVRFAGLVREAFEKGTVQYTMSPRTLISWGRKTRTFHGDIKLAFRMSFFNKLIESDQKIIAECYHKIFLENL